MRADRIVGPEIGLRQRSPHQAQLLRVHSIQMQCRRCHRPDEQRAEIHIAAATLGATTPRSDGLANAREINQPAMNDSTSVSGRVGAVVRSSGIATSPSGTIAAMMISPIDGRRIDATRTSAATSFIGAAMDGLAIKRATAYAGTTANAKLAMRDTFSWLEGIARSGAHWTQPARS